MRGPSSTQQDALVERGRERDALARALRRAADGDGALVLVRGPAGIGKTALLRATQRGAAAAGAQVLAASASRFDRDFPFAVVHQLLGRVAADPERRDRLFAGAARLAEPLLRGDGPPDAAAEDPTFAVLHGLYWAIANLAADDPVVVVLDDLQWADRGSLRLVEFLARRLEGLRVLVAAAVRPGEPVVDAELLDALTEVPGVVVLEPAPLGRDGIGTVLARTLGTTPEDGFVSACAAATGGNPLMVDVLARTAREDGLRGVQADADRLMGLGAAGLGEHVRRRLARLGPHAEDVARAHAVAGRALNGLPPVPGVPEAEVARLTSSLVAAQLLEPDGGFVHPLVRETVLGAIPAHERDVLHRAVAGRLRERGGRPEEIGMHLLATAADADEAVADALREAATAVLLSGQAAEAATFLRRALRQTLPAPVRTELLVELGEALRLAGHPEASESLEAALAGDPPPAVRARGELALARVHLGRDPARACAALEGLLHVDDEGLAADAEAVALDATFADLRLADRRHELLERPGPATVARRVHAIVEDVHAGAGREAVEGRIQALLADGTAVERLGADALAVNLLVQAARLCEAPDLAWDLLRLQERAGARRGSVVANVLVEQGRAYWHWYFGSVADGEAHAAAASSRAAAADLRSSSLALTAVWCELRVEQGRLDEADRVLERFGALDATATLLPVADVLAARARVRRLRGDRAAAVADLRRARDLHRARGWRAPLRSRAGLRLAELLAETGETDEARELADELAAVARAAGLPGALGMALRARARAAEDPVPVLEDAIRALRDSSLRLELGWTQLALGDRLRAAGRRADARDPLREALDIASRTGAELLAREAREQLLAAGARPRRRALTGPESLTPGERRVVDLAVEGLTNREIAETLWVTTKTVEVHLGSAYAKLGIRSRKQLAGALAEA